AGDAGTSAKQVLLAIVFLPHQAWISGDAIARTLWRLLVSRRNLLEWRTASQAERGEAGGAGRLWSTMLPAVVLALIILVVAVALEFRVASATLGTGDLTLTDRLRALWPLLP